MDTPSSSMRDLAQRLLAESRTTSDPHAHEAVLASEKLRIYLIRFVGIDGYASLLRRALVLAGEDVPSLQSVKVGADGRLEGFERPGADTGTDKGRSKAAVALTAHLLGLLATFIGETFAQRLVREAWAGTSLDK